MSDTLTLLHGLAALIVLAEALNKLERCDPLQPGLARRARVVAVLKAVAWILIAIGAGGAVVRPALVAGAHSEHVGVLLLVRPPSIVDVMYILGFAILIVRDRLKEH